MDIGTTARPTERHPPRRASCGRFLQDPWNNRQRPRRGISLVEVTVAAVVMSALVLMLGQAAGWVAVAQRDADLRQLALLEAGNVLEQITALTFDAVDAERARESGLSDHASQLLGADALKVDVQSVDDEPRAKRITVAVQYKESAAAQGSIHLTAWIYQRGGP